jgi:peptidoglycan hydrolase CwlO-like protein
METILLLVAAIFLLIVMALYIIFKLKLNIIIKRVESNTQVLSNEEKTIRTLNGEIYGLKDEIKKANKKISNYHKVNTELRETVNSLQDELRLVKEELNNERIDKIFKQQNSYPTHA